MNANTKKHPRPRAKRFADPLGVVILICGLFLAAPASGDSYGLSMFGLFLMIAGFGRIFVSLGPSSSRRELTVRTLPIDGSERCRGWPWRDF